MKNRFKARLNSIENLILDLKNPKKEAETTKQTKKLLTVQEAVQSLNLTVPTIYSKVSRNEMPVMKRYKRLYLFITEIIAVADTYLSNIKKGLNYGK